MSEAGHGDDRRRDDVVWLTEVSGDRSAEPPAPRGSRRRIGVVGVLAAALLATAGLAASRHDASIELEREAATARQERDELAERLARTEARLAEIQDQLDRTERARLSAVAHLADMQLFAILPANVRGPNG